MYLKSRRGLSPIVGVTLFLTLTIFATVNFQNWYNSFSSSVFIDVETSSNSGDFNTGIEDVIGENLYFNNAENQNITINKISIDGESCNNISKINKSGIQTINIQNCLEGKSGEIEVTLYSNKGVYSKKKFISQTSSDNSNTYASNLFVSVWNTSVNLGSSGSPNITLPLQSGGTYNFNVTWGDGNSSIVTSQSDSDKTHIYSENGTYEVIINGTIEGFSFKDLSGSKKISNIKQWGDLILANGGEQFNGADNLKITANDSPNLSTMTNMRRMFSYATNFNSNINHWNTSNIENMERVFFDAVSFNQPLNNWDTSSANDMSNMFDGATNFNRSINSWDTSKVTEMDRMFHEAVNFNQPLNNWNTSSVSNMNRMFRNANSFNQDLNNWSLENVTDMRRMFSSANSFNGKIDDWKFPKVKNLQSFFSSANSFNQSINNWRVNNITNMRFMFNYANSFDQPLDKWNTSSAEDMTRMFFSADRFNQNVSMWNTSSATDMGKMFAWGSDFNQNLSTWDVDQVTTCDNFDAGMSFPIPNFTNCNT